MTFSLLARDPSSGTLGGVAATGNLCVGGWVLGGTPGVGVTASQGQAPSTLWHEQAQTRMTSGASAEDAVAATVESDQGREYRQLTAFDINGKAGSFTGSSNGNYKGHLEGVECIASGNILTGSAVLEAMVQTFESTGSSLENRLFAALLAGQQAGGDERGIQSAAMLIVSNNNAPFSLRIDHHITPVAALGELLQKSQHPAYQAWLNTVPTKNEPQRFASMGSISQSGSV